MADDHADVAGLLQAILEEEFEVVATVHDGLALLAAADSLAPDVVVTDIAMPRMDGLAATAELVHKQPNARVVLVTMLDRPDIVCRGLAAGALGYVVKLRADQDLLPAVRAALRGERFVGGSSPISGRATRSPAPPRD
jgi:DNA-binding NarL/FixJ family response regulator